MIIKLCFNLTGKSSSAYKDHDSHGSGLAVLASLNTLGDCKLHKTIKGIYLYVINDLQKKASCFSEIERYFTILLDKMKIQQDLVWDKHAGDLIRFSDLGVIYTNYATLNSIETLPSHVLVFLVKSVVNPLSYVLF